jgi:peptidoglycan/LPS O-acetylase OafA/YrhL
MEAHSREKELTVSSDAFTFRHFPQLDGLRGLAILLVIASHVLHYDFGLGAPGSLGGLGVLLFFVLSGFLITGLLDREMLQTGGIGLSTFYLRRVLRLFPALFCFLGVLCFLVKLGIVKDTRWYTVAACLFYVRNMWGRGASSGHIWSLSIEEQFYLLWPWVMRAFSRIAALQIATAGVIAVSLFRMAAIYMSWSSYGGGAIYERLWFRFDSILIGCAVALVLCQSANISHLRTYLSSSALPAFLWPGVLAWTMWGEAATHVWYLTVQMILATLILVNLLLSRDSVYLLAFSHPAAGWFGRISYSWYLWQQLFTVFTAPSWHGMRTFPFNVAASLLLATISSRLIERPFLQLKERIGKGSAELPVRTRASSPLAAESHSSSRKVSVNSL